MRVTAAMPVIPVKYLRKYMVWTGGKVDPTMDEDQVSSLKVKSFHLLLNEVECAHETRFGTGV